MHCCLAGKKWYIQGLINYVIFCTNSTNSYISSYTTMHMQTWQKGICLNIHHNTHINYTSPPLPSPLVLTILCIKFNISTLWSLQQRWSPSYMWVLAVYWHVEHTCMTAPFQTDGTGAWYELNSALSVSGHECCFFFHCFYYISEQCSILLLSFGFVLIVLLIDICRIIYDMLNDLS